MKILVTGGAGFIGTNLIKRLLNEGHEVVSWDNYSTGLSTNCIDHKNVQYHDKDITKLNNSLHSFHQNYYDVVYHLAAIARIQPSFDRPVDSFDTNAMATMKLAKMCADANIPFIYAGSSSHHSGKYKNPYTFSKDIGEDIIKLYQEHFGLKASIARFYNVYGPHQLKEGAYCTVIGKWEKSYENNTPLIIYGDGLKRRDFTHVEDIVDALLLIFEKQSWGHIFELGRGKNYSIKEIANMYPTKILYRENQPGEAQITLCTDTLARKLLGWEPKLDIDDYIKEYLNDK